MIRATIVLLGLIALCLMKGGIPMGGEVSTAIFHSPLFILLLATLSGLLVLGCARYGRGVRGLIFWPVHLGVILILLGAGLGALHGVEGKMTVPVAGWHVATHLPLPDGRNLPLGFGFSAEDFEVDHYDPSYSLYKPLIENPRSVDDYGAGEEVVLSAAGTLELKGYGSVPREQLWNGASSTWVEELGLPNGWVLQRRSPTPKEFRATLKIEQGTETSSHILKVNHPATANQWRIYLMSYELHPQPFILVSVRRDPGRSSVIAGIWCVIFGTALLCWRKRGATREGGAR